MERLPDGSAALVFRAATDGTAASLSAMGPLSRALYKRTSVRSLTVAITFEPGSAYPFFGIPMQVLNDRVVPLEEIWGPTAARLRQGLATCSSGEQILGRLEQMLSVRLEQAQELELSAAVRVARAVRRLATAHEITDVGEIARRLGLSDRQLRRSFSTAVGIGPKAYLRMLRFQRAAAALDLPGGEMAIAAGYYDQAHLIGEFQHLARMTPRAFAQRHLPSLAQSLQVCEQGAAPLHS